MFLEMDFIDCRKSYKIFLFRIFFVILSTIGKWMFEILVSIFTVSYLDF
ncbi:hypothetical protein LEP1GSC013_0316 [Leptospira interrogans serovar Valbuzzi str. Duyster]|nr:hypothetical protein LEP1GSC013_0316 [Leptospira interrogans serovar Valbuzzi str. Duyster]